MVPIVWMILVLDPHSLGLVSTLIPVLDICSVQVKIVKLLFATMFYVGFIP